MSEGDALLRAVCAAPEDDAPRLVIADWFDERGQCDRAEYIRVQCELVARHKRRKYGLCAYKGDGCMCKDCKHRASFDLEDSDLLTTQSRLQTQRNLRGWFVGVDLLATHVPRTGQMRGHIERGFVADVSFKLLALEQQMAVAFRDHPIQRAHVIGYRPTHFDDGLWRFPLVLQGSPSWLAPLNTVEFATLEAATSHMSGVLLLRGRTQVGL